MSSSTGDTVAAAPAPSAGSPGKSDVWWIAAAAAVVLACHLQIALTRGINWDEFHHYSLIRQFEAGALTDALQTFYTRLYAWILQVPGDVTDHIRAARLVMLACEAGASIAVFGLARRFASDTAAALTALAYFSGGFVVIHGTAFRADPQAALLLTSALWLLASARLRPLAILTFGLLAGLAVMITIKVVFWAPAFAGIAWLRWRESSPRPENPWRIIACVAASLAVAAGLYAWHAGAVTPQPQGGTLGSAGRVVFSEGLVPQWRGVVRQLLIAPHVTALLIVTAACWSRLRMTRDQRLAMIGLLAPLVVLLIYRNSYPYFFVFLLPPVLVATAPVMDRVLLQRFGVAPIAIFMALAAIALAWQEPRDVLPGQKRTIAAAHEMFPRRTAYFDFCGYLGDHDRAIPFMPSGWGLSEYRRAGRPRLVEAMSERPIPLLVLNHNVLISAVLNRRGGEQLLEADRVALRDNYIPHWGILWVAGKALPAGAAPLEIDVRVPGRYTLEGGAITLDGVARKSGDVVELNRGAHQVGGARAAKATLRWGERLRVPTDPPPETEPYARLE